MQRAGSQREKKPASASLNNFSTTLVLGQQKKIGQNVRAPKSRQTTRDAWSRTFNLDSNPHNRPIILVGKQMNQLTGQKTLTSKMTLSNDKQQKATGMTHREEEPDMNSISPKENQ